VIPDIGDMTLDAAGEGTAEYVMPLMTKEMDKGIGRRTASDVAMLVVNVVPPDGTWVVTFRVGRLRAARCTACASSMVCPTYLPLGAMQKSAVWWGRWQCVQKRHWLGLACATKAMLMFVPMPGVCSARRFRRLASCQIHFSTVADVKLGSLTICWIDDWRWSKSPLSALTSAIALILSQLMGPIVDTLLWIDSISWMVSSMLCP
jgi:hypothetical protein